MRILLSAALAALLVGTVARPAYAQDTEDAEILRMAKEHYKLGLDAFKAGRYPEAIKELKKAYLLKRLPPLLINIAKTYEKLGDVDNEIYYYKKYLAEAPPDAHDRDQVKQRIDDLVAQKNGAPPPSEATPPAETPQAAPPPEQEQTEQAPPPRRRPQQQQQQQAEQPPAEQAPPPASPPPAAPPPSSMPSEWTHTPIDAVPPGQPVDVRVQTPVMKGVKVWLFYRGKGESDYKQLEMKRRGPEKIARIPGGDVQGKSFQYYIEAKDPSGAIVKSSGSQTDPNIVMIDPSAPVQLASASQAPRNQEPQEETREPAPSEEAPPPAEERPPRRPANPDEEAAPLGPREERGEVPPLGQPTEKKSGGPSGLLIAGIGLAAGGVLVGAVGGGVGFYFAGAYASAVQQDAYPNCKSLDPAFACKGPYIFNDPNAQGDNDKNYQDKGHLSDIMGGVSIGVGAALALTGGALILVDMLNHQPKTPKATHHRRRAPEAAPSDEAAPPPEAAPPSEPAPPPDETPPPPQSSIQNFIAVPVVTSQTVGLGAGFQF